MRIDEKLVFKKSGDKPASDSLNEFMLKKAKEIKLTVPFEASGKFEKIPMQPDGITPIIVNKPTISGGSGVKVEKLEEKVEPKIKKEEVVKKVEKKTTKKK
jgi:hypothetical protein